VPVGTTVISAIRVSKAVGKLGPDAVGWQAKFKRRVESAITKKSEKIKYFFMTNLICTTNLFYPETSQKS
jgi:hypothetical protein